MIHSVLKDVLLFFIGFILGTILNMIYAKVSNSINDVILLFLLGLSQIAIISVLLQCTKIYFSDIGFFMLGIISTQALIIHSIKQ